MCTRRLNETGGGSSSPSLASFGRAQSLSGLASSNQTCQQLYAVGGADVSGAGAGLTADGHQLLLSPQQHIERLDAESLAALTLYLTLLCLMAETLLEMHSVNELELLLADALAEPTFSIYIRQHYIYKFIVRDEDSVLSLLYMYSTSSLYSVSWFKLNRNFRVTDCSRNREQWLPNIEDRYQKLEVFIFSRWHPIITTFRLCFDLYAIWSAIFVYLNCCTYCIYEYND